MGIETYGPPPTGPSAVSPPMPAAAPASADALPTSVWLTLPGAAGKEIAAYDLDKETPFIVIDGVRAKKDLNGYAVIPMAEGGNKKLKIRALIPGYPTLIFQGQKVYTVPRPSVAHVASLVVFLFGVLVLGVATFGFVGSFLTGLAAYGAIAWLRKARNKTVPHVVLTSLGVAFIAIAAVVFGWLLG